MAPFSAGHGAEAHTLGDRDALVPARCRSALGSGFDDESVDAAGNAGARGCRLRAVAAATWGDAAML